MKKKRLRLSAKVEEVQTKKPIDFKPFFMSLVAAAAAVVITLSVQDKTAPTVEQPIAQKPVELPVIDQELPVQDGIVTNSPDIWGIPVSLKDMEKQSTGAHDLKAAQQFLVANNFDLNITNPNTSNHDVKFVGAKKTTFEGEEVMVLYYSCCGEPMKVLISCKGGKFCDHIKEDMVSDHPSNIKFQKIVNNYRVALIGAHNYNEVLTTISGPQI